MATFAAVPVTWPLRGLRNCDGVQSGAECARRQFSLHPALQTYDYLLHFFGFGYFFFQFVTFTPIRNWADIDLNQIILRTGIGRDLDIWRETRHCEGSREFLITPRLLPFLYRGRPVHARLTGEDCVRHCFRALWKRYRFWGHVIYLVLLLSALASLLKPIVFWRFPQWSGLVPAVACLNLRYCDGLNL